MRILGVTQGSNLKVFLRLTEILRIPLSVDRIGVYVSDSREFEAISKDIPLINDSSLIELLKEWEITGDGAKIAPDWGLISDWEKRLGDPVLWNTLMADRRIYFGRKCKMRQDYTPRFSYNQMGGILQVALERCNHFTKSIKPDVIIGFGTSTIGDYVFYRIAKTQNIPYLQLKATKIGNYVSLNDDAVELSRHIADFYYGKKTISEGALQVARQHIQSIRDRGVRYEGAIKSRVRFQPIQALAEIAKGTFTDVKRQLSPIQRHDNHLDSAFLSALYSKIVNPLNGWLISLRLQHHIFDLEKLCASRPFVFYPMHFEPEVSMQVFGRPYQNQIEVIRALAMSLPAGMLVIVKEHPRAYGFRPLSYYKKLLDIPNVRLVDTDIPTNLVIRHASLVAVISGSTGLEAAIFGKPVLVFGVPTYTVLPMTMVRRVSDMHQIGVDVRVLINNYKLDAHSLELYVASQIADAVPIDLYSVLLSKQGRYSEGREGLSRDEKNQQDSDALATYCAGRIIAEVSIHSQS